MPELKNDLRHELLEYFERFKNFPYELNKEPGDRFLSGTRHLREVNRMYAGSATTEEIMRGTDFLTAELFRRYVFNIMLRAKIINEIQV